MYQPPIFREERVEVMHELMRAHPFATLVSIQDGSPAADHLPLLLHPEPSGTCILRGHVAKGNPLWTKGTSSGDVLAIFQGPQAYVTPSWYPSKKEHGKVVPTWNYAVVHAYGSLRFVEDGAWLHEHLNTLTRRHESGRDVPWEVADAPTDYLDHMMKGIVGIEFAIARLEGKWKMSQNRSSQDRAGVEQGLLAGKDGNAAAVSEMVGRLGGHNG